MLLSSGIAFSALFSLFPLLLIAISLIGYKFSKPEVVSGVNEIIERFFPCQVDVIMQNVQTIANDSGKIGLVGILMLLWAARGLFLAIEYSINKIWGTPTSRSIIGRNLTAFLSIFIMGVVLYFSLILSTVIAFLTRLEIPVFNITLSKLSFWGSINKWLVSTIIIFIFFVVLFKVMPHTRIKVKDIMPGALFAAICWKISELSYIWYMSNMGRLSEVYGSIGGVIGVLLWLHITAIVFLLGAEFNLSYKIIKNPEKNTDEGKSQT